MESEIAAPPVPAASARVEFANRCGIQLLVFGWVLGLATRVARAEIRYGDVVIDLKSLGLQVPRFEVARHYSGVEPGDDRDGFYLLVELPDFRARTSYLRLSVSQHSGELAESVWPMSAGDAPLTTYFQQNPSTLDWLLRHLEPPAAERLRHLAATANVLPAVRSPRGTSGPLRFTVNLCCLLSPQCLVVLGRMSSLPRQVTAATMRCGDCTLNVLGNLELTSPVDGDVGFSLVVEPPARIAGSAEVVIEVACAAGRAQARRVVQADSPTARGEILSELDSLDDGATLTLLERIAPLLGDASHDASLAEWLGAAHTAAVERLPVSLASNSAGVYLHCDRAVRIGDDDLYIEGWSHARDGAVLRVACHRGFQSVAIDADWIRHPRKDVAEHLGSLGVLASDHEHGFSCFVELEPARAPCFLSATSLDGQVHRMRLPQLHPVPALQAVRTVLTSFPASSRFLGALFDGHVGPAVQKAWARRRQPTQPVTLQRYGSPSVAPAVSVIVPLYGRHDFAEYQLALFADDPDFQSLELIYFVDDPAITDEFRLRCADLWEMYRVPFTLAFDGVNHGFAGANNRAAAVAGGRHLLLLNSDVLPKTPGWVAQMLSCYATLDEPGILGVKLLYEDGSVQHAGMAFRRHAPWNDWWVNDHPHKGQSALGLSGLRKVDAVTAACALVSADLYRELGGLSEDYIIGDFEDSDFCLRAAARGRRHWVSLDIELYHLERQSQVRIGDAYWRANLTLYNCWQHSRRWGAHLDQHAR